MLEKTIDNRGLSCPQPVINTKKALEELAQKGINVFTLTVIVDNEAAKENVMRMVRTAGYEPTVEAKEKDFSILIESLEDRGQGGMPELEGCSYCENEGGERETVLVFTSPCLGQGSEELGKILMRSFIFTIKETSLPSKMLFLNSGVFLTTDGSPLLDDLKELAEMGVEILSCGTCLDYYGLKEKLAVGIVTNMYDTVEAMQAAVKCITL
jgi:selenium metabolism protein YedF